MNPNMLFILGRGRSGTTLLSSILNGNDEICIAPECLFVMNLAGKYKNVKITSRNIDQFCDDLYLEERIHNWAFTKEELRDYLYRKLLGNEARSFEQIVYSVYEAHAHYSGKQSAFIMGDKNPHYSLFAIQLKKMFPNAYWIHIVRDPRATVASYKQVKFDYNGTGLLAGRWKVYNEHILQANLAETKRYLMIRYEDLVDNPDEVNRGILNFLGVGNVGLRTAKIKAEQHTKQLEWHRNLSGEINLNFESTVH